MGLQFGIAEVLGYAKPFPPFPPFKKVEPKRFIQPFLFPLFHLLKRWSQKLSKSIAKEIIKRFGSTFPKGGKVERLIFSVL
jgi:hypothetical protein